MGKGILTATLIALCLALTACDNSPTPVQEEIVNSLLQEQIDIPYVEQDWNRIKDQVEKRGETVEQLAARSKKTYSDIHDYLLELTTKPYAEKKAWAIRMIELELEGLEGGIAFLEKHDKDASEITGRQKKLKSMLEVLR